MRKQFNSSPFLPSEKKAVVSLAGIYFLRMFGVFMILPILSIYALTLDGATPLLIGFSLGVYGLTQACLQIPFGLLSDHFDRKMILSLGLIIFAIGSVIAAVSDSIVWLIVGRAVQGAGAVSAVILALAADLTRKEQRTKSMAIIGISIGFAFFVSLIVSPYLQQHIGVSGLFLMVAVLSCMAVFVVLKIVPDVDPEHTETQITHPGKQLTLIFRNPVLMQLNIGVGLLHLVLTALFLVLPWLFSEQNGWELSSHWQLYLIILSLSVIGMLPFVIAAAKPALIRNAYIIAILTVALSLVALFVGFSASIIAIVLFAALFFSGFNALESLLPSMISQVVDSDSKGAALGVFNTFQFSGIFLGGTVGGLISGAYGHQGILLLCFVCMVVWVVLAMLTSRSLFVSLSRAN